MRKIAYILCLIAMTAAVLVSVSCRDSSDEEPGSYVDPSEWEDDGDAEGGKTDGGNETEKVSPVRGDAANSGDSVITPELRFDN